MQCIYLLCMTFTINLTTQWFRVFLGKVTTPQLVMKFPTFPRTWTVITVLTTAHHLEVNWTRWIQSMHSYPISLWCILILSLHLYVNLPSHLFPPKFHHQNPYAFLFSFECAICPVHLILLDWSLHNIWWAAEIRKLLITHFFQPPDSLPFSVVPKYLKFATLQRVHYLCLYCDFILHSVH